MKIVYELVTDAILYTIQGWLFYHFLTTVLETEPLRGKRKRLALIVLILPFFCLRMLVMRSIAFQKLLYGGQIYIQNSRDTIISNALSFLLLLCCACIFYRKWKGLAAYLTLVYTAVSEMLRFGIYCITAWFPQIAFFWLNHRLLDQESISIEQYYYAADIIQAGWNLLFFALYLWWQYMILRRCGRYLTLTKQRPGRREMVYLAISPVVCLCFGFLFRSIFLVMREGQMHMVFDENKALYIIVPGITFCSIFLLVSGIEMRYRLIEEAAEKSRLQIYQNQIENMETYIGDLEGMQESIRGMKHDMKNYVADIHALLHMTWKPQIDVEQKEIFRRELSGYLAGMDERLEQFQFHYKTKNPVTDVIINRFLQQAGQEGISAECHFAYPEELGINPFDLSIILNNAWNNAMEACRKQEKGERFIYLYGMQKEQIFFLEMKNSMGEGSIQKEADGFLKSTKQKEGEHGLGLKNIAGCVEKYGGHMEFGEREGVFFLTILLPKNRL